MPNIPIIEQTAVKFRQNTADVSAEAFGAGIGEALQKAGQSAQRVGAQLEAKRKADDKLRAEKFLAEFQQEELIRLTDEQEVETEPRGFSDRYSKRRDDRWQSALNEQSFDDESRRYVETRYAQTVQTSTLRNALTYEHTESIKQTGELWKSLIADKATVVRLDPESLTDQLASVEALADEYGLQGTIRSGFIATYRDALTLSAARGRMDTVTTVDQAVELHESFKDAEGVWRKNIDGEEFEKLLALSEANIHDARVRDNRERVERERRVSIQMGQQYTDLVLRHRRGELREMDVQDFRSRFWNEVGGASYVGRLNALFYGEDGASAEVELARATAYRDIQKKIRNRTLRQADIDDFEARFGNTATGQNTLARIEDLAFQTRDKDPFEDPMVIEFFDLDLAISEAGPGELAALEKQISEFDEKWRLIKDGTRLSNSLHKALAEQRQARVGSDVDLYRLALANQQDPRRFPLDPANKDHKAAVELYWQQTVVPQIESLPPDMSLEDRNATINNLVAQTVRNSGIIPESVRGVIRAKLVSSVPALNAEGAMMLRAIHNESPLAPDALNQRHIRFGLDLMELMERGFTPEQAVQRAREAEQISRTEREGLGREWDTNIAPNIDINDDATQAEIFGRPQILGVIGTQKEIPPAARADFMALYREEYIRTQDEVTARHNAGRIFQQKWSVSTIHDSSGAWEFLPPDKFYGVPNVDNAKWIKEQAAAEILENSFFAEDSPVDEAVRAGRIRFIPVAGRVTPDGLPAYRLAALTDTGWVDLQLPPFVPNYEQSPQRAKLRKREAEARQQLAEDINTPGFIERDTRINPTSGLEFTE